METEEDTGVWWTMFTLHWSSRSMLNSESHVCILHSYIMLPGLSLFHTVAFSDIMGGGGY